MLLYKKQKLMYKLCVVNVCFVFFLYSCSNSDSDKSVETNQDDTSTSTTPLENQSPSNTDIDNSINNGDTVNTAEYPFKARIAHSLDIALVSDPFFVAIFNTLSYTHFELFYLNAAKLGVNAQLFTVFDTSSYDESVLQDTFLVNHSPLSDGEMNSIMYAKSIIISPLLAQFNPVLVNTLVDYRKAIHRDSPLVFSLKRRNNTPTTMYVDSSYALYAMAQEIIKTLDEGTPPQRLVILANLGNPIQEFENLRVLLRTLYHFRPDINPDIQSIARNFGEEGKTVQKLTELNINTKEVVVLSVGVHLNSALQYMIKNSQRWEKRVFLLETWHSEITEHAAKKGIVVASIDNEKDIFFRKKKYTYAQLRRYK